MGLCGVGPAAAAEGRPILGGASLELWWVLPFAGLLLSIALLPQLSPRFWHRHFGKVAAVWALLFLMPFAATHGLGLAIGDVLHTALLEYLPFVILLFALFVISGGIRVRGNLVGTPAVNTGLLALGTALASVAGTTGAAMLLVRPLIQANLKRRSNVHVLVFFIFLVANIGGSLTPLGDPPLFLGFLQGVTFGWTLKHMVGPMLLCSVLLLAVFYALDCWTWARDGGPRRPDRLRFGFKGLHNVVYLSAAVAAVLVSGLWNPDIELNVWHVAVPLQSIVRDAVLLGLAGLSWATTKRRVRIENAFTWDPILEVAYLFAGIFVTILPALAILKAGPSGALAPVVALASAADGQPHDAAYFWMTGLLSAFLDNAPTYLVFFNMAGGDPQALMGPLARTLLAISAGSVFMGAMTYIGNATNFMIRSIASERGIRMPSFFGYLAWSATALLPLFVLVTALFFTD
jgi:Na+/H+ antiporter NhaD/arsenite permease-like protein